MIAVKDGKNKISVIYGFSKLLELNTLLSAIIPRLLYHVGD